MLKHLEVEVISKEIIKPSSATPHHLRRHRLSFLDQISPPIFMPMILFYSGEEIENNDNKLDSFSNHLKQSLSRILSQYYMLAGRVSEDNLYVDCNDDGVPFFEARANCKLYDLINDPDPNEFSKLLAYDLDDVKDLGMAVQVNLFSCGGVAVGVGISHKITDAMGFCHLMNNWSVVARGDDRKMLPPRFVGAEIFPPLELGSYLPSIGMVPMEDIVVKRFVFPTSKIVELQDRYTEDTIRPSRIEALSVFIWSRFIAKVEGGGDPNKTYLIIHPVNLRRRGSTTNGIDDRCFGNIYRITITEPTKDEHGKYSDVMRKMREAMKSIDDAYVAKLQEGGEDHLDFLQEMMELFLKGEVVVFSFTSLCRFSLYESDFGFGKPVWFGSSRFDFNNLVSFVDTRLEDGVEAWINMSPKDMAKFEVDDELLSWTS